MWTKENKANENKAGHMQAGKRQAQAVNRNNKQLQFATIGK